MAAIQGDRDNTLQNTAVRLVYVSSNYISLSASSNSFNVVGGVASPSSLTITATLFGQLKGVPTFSVVSGSTGISQQTIGGKAVATINYSSLTADSAVIRASLTYLGLTYTADISIAGQTVPPANVSTFTATVFGTNIRLAWSANIDADIAGYEIRTTNSGWGTAGYVFKGSANTVTIATGSLGSNTTWYIKAYDISGLYSASATSTSYGVVAPVDVDLNNITYEYADTSLTNATVTIKWDPVSPVFGLKEYQVIYTPEGSVTPTTLIVRNNLIVLNANWVGSKPFTLKVVDNLGNVSAGVTKYVTKALPNAVLNFKATSVDNNVYLTWTLPTKTSLPISHVILKRGLPGGTWDTATLIGIKAGEFTTIQEMTKGDYVYWAATVDTDDNETATPVSYPCFVNSPPDFVFNKQFVSTLTGTRTNAVKPSSDHILFPVNTTETWQQHFVNNSWTTPSAQVSAKYPVYAQPGTSSATYEEVFDYGNGASLILPSSTITVGFTGTDVIGTTSVVVSISTSADGTTYTAPVASSSLFATNFRFVKVTLTATRGSGDGVTNIGSLYRLTGLTVTLSTKLKTDSGMVNTTTDSLGTYVNFTTEFIDISSITLSPLSTSPRICTYSFSDEIYTCSFSIVSNILTVTVNTGSSSGTVTDHKLYPGQNVRLSTLTGVIPSGVYTVASRVSATQFTVAVTATNSSGTNNLYLYPNTMRIFVFDTLGTQKAESVSWTVRGT